MDLCSTNWVSYGTWPFWASNARPISQGFRDLQHIADRNCSLYFHIFRTLEVICMWRLGQWIGYYCMLDVYVWFGLQYTGAGCWVFYTLYPCIFFMASLLMLDCRKMLAKKTLNMYIHEVPFFNHYKTEQIKTMHTLYWINVYVLALEVSIPYIYICVWNLVIIVSADVLGVLVHYQAHWWWHSYTFFSWNLLGYKWLWAANVDQKTSFKMTEKVLRKVIAL